jgi:AcrR family transcriptional regulator
MSDVDTRVHLLDAALKVIARRGLHGMTMRAVAKEADCALGLLNYHFDDKDALIVEAYQRIADRLMSAADADTDDATTPDEKVDAYLRVVFKPEFLATDYLSLRLSLWAAVESEPKIGELNRQLDLNYWGGLATLISKARPALSKEQAQDRATDVVIAQNGIWLTWVVRPDEAALKRCIDRCHQVALAAA